MAEGFITGFGMHSYILGLDGSALPQDRDSGARARKISSIAASFGNIADMDFDVRQASPLDAILQRPSPVIDTNSEFFFGTGDGSIGYYAERPIR